MHGNCYQGESTVFSSLKNRIFAPHRETAHVRAAMAKLLHVIPRANTLLDVGCGDGHATRRYANIWNIPLQSIAGIEAQPKYIRSIDSFRVHSLDIEWEVFPFGDEEFDVVVCNQVIEHLKIVLFPLREMARVVREGGYLAIGIPNLASLISRAYLLLGMAPTCLAFPGPHIRGFTHRPFVGFLRSNPNFTVKAITGAIFYPIPPPVSEWMARLLPGGACYTFYLLQKIHHRPERDWPTDQYLDESITG
jgi:ubiquinone/menaquinone biosynthesis C-methylase UbiE